MANVSLSLRIASIFIVWTASACGVLWPFLVATAGTAESSYFKLMKACAAGVMLGIALMHLLPDADEDLQDVSPDYSLAFAMTCAGVVLNLALEQMAMIGLAARKQGKRSRKNTLVEGESEDSKAHTHDANCGLIKCAHDGDLEAGATAQEGHEYAGVDASCGVDEVTQTPDAIAVRGSETPTAVGKLAEDIVEDEEADEDEELISGLMDAKTLRDMISLYAMELSISVHSIIIGVDIGLLAGDSHMATLVSLICAITFHQFVEGSGLGTILRTMRHVTSSTKVFVFVLLFSLTTPLGIFIGLMTASQPQTPVQVAVKGIANALACGSLLYISLTEMVGTYFTAPELNDQPKLKLQMIALFALGIASMAIIAIWA